MKKIGLITFHNAINYGAFFQAQALEKNINMLSDDFSCEIIDYQSEYFKQMYKPLQNCSLKEILRVPSKIKKNRKFKKYSKKYFSMSKPIKKTELYLLNKDYDEFVTGSDQVFSYSINGNDFTYFLDFVDDEKKKISYAASFGNYVVPDNLKEKYAQLLMRFSALSSREPRGADIISSLIEKKCDVNLDPTLAINPEYWLNIVKNYKPPMKQKYILIYCVPKPKEIFETARAISEQTGWEIVYMVNDFARPKKGIKQISVSPDEWINYVKNAELVITNSFHGTAFSVIFNKPFFVQLESVYSNSTVTKNVHNDRAENLLQICHLENRTIDNALTEYKSKIDWQTANELLNVERQKATDYLTNALK